MSDPTHAPTAVPTQGSSARVVTLRPAPPPSLVQRLGPRKSRPARLVRDVSAREALSANLARAADDIAWNGACTLAGDDPEAVHQLRVALRRLRAVLSLYRKLLPKRARAELRDLVRAVNAPLGRARDMDVFADDVLAPAVRAIGADPGLEALAEATARERARRREAARDAVRSEDFTRLLKSVGALAHAHPRGAGARAILAAPARRLAREVLRRRHKRLRRTGRHLRRMGPAERHVLRIAVKKQRYAAELFAPLFAGSVTARVYAKALARVQGALGAINDAAVAPAQLKALGADPGPGALARGAELVLGFHVEQADARERRLRRAWKRFQSAKTFWKK